jgi:hypothetical protein
MKNSSNTTNQSPANLTLFIEDLGPPDFTSQANYITFCQRAADLWRSSVDNTGIPSPDFTREREAVSSPGQDIIQVPAWGGVHITKHEHPFVEKFLVVDSGKFLAFEKHAEKTETLRHVAGLGLLVFRRADSSTLSVAAVEPGFEVTLLPGQEHCLISLENLLVFESGTDPKGMDKDLIFIFEPPPA